MPKLMSSPVLAPERVVVVPASAEPGTWDLLVDGAPRVACESFAVCDAVREELVGRGGVLTEVREVADVIRRHLPGAVLRW